jgi:hypothetical protein
MKGFFFSDGDFANSCAASIAFISGEQWADADLEKGGMLEELLETVKELKAVEEFTQKSEDTKLSQDLVNACDKHKHNETI